MKYGSLTGKTIMLAGTATSWSNARQSMKWSCCRFDPLDIDIAAGLPW